MASDIKLVFYSSTRKFGIKMEPINGGCAKLRNVVAQIFLLNRQDYTD